MCKITKESFPNKSFGINLPCSLYKSREAEHQERCAGVDAQRATSTTLSQNITENKSNVKHRRDCQPSGQSRGMRKTNLLTECGVSATHSLH